jgi:hypothetical protein
VLEARWRLREAGGGEDEEEGGRSGGSEKGSLEVLLLLLINFVCAQLSSKQSEGERASCSSNFRS